MPRNITARPTTDFARENIFNVIENRIDLEGIAALDLFAGTGAISFELLSRGCASVTAVEKSGTQYAFIRKVAQTLGETNLRLIKGDVFKFIAADKSKYDFIFADPPYALPELPQLPKMILERGMLKPGGIFVFEHGKHNSFEDVPGFIEHRAYGSVNFSLFRQPEAME